MSINVKATVDAINADIAKAKSEYNAAMAKARVAAAAVPKEYQALIALEGRSPLIGLAVAGIIGGALIGLAWIAFHL